MTNGERIGFDLYPYTEDQVGAVRRSVLNWRWIDEVAGRIDEDALRRRAAGQGRGARERDRVRRPRAAPGLTHGHRRRAGRRHHRGQGASRCPTDGEVLARAEREYPLSTPRPGWSEQNPDDWWRATEQALDGARRRRRRRHRALGPDARARRARRRRRGRSARRSSGTTSAPAPSARRSRSASASSGSSQLTGNRALTGFTAPKLLWLRKHEPERYARIAHVLLPKDYVRLRLTGERAIDVADASGTLLFDVARRRWSDEVLDALEIAARVAADARSSRPRSRAGRPTGVRSPRRGRSGGGRARRRRRPPRAAVDRARHVRRRVRRAARVRAPTPQARVHAFCHAVPGAWHAMGVMLSAAGSLAWLRRAVAPGERVLRRSYARPRPGSPVPRG